MYVLLTPGQLAFIDIAKNLSREKVDLLCCAQEMYRCLLREV
jgi:hypothetical protein